MGCDTCKSKDVASEAAGYRAAIDMGRRCKIMTAAIAFLVVVVGIMAGCMVYMASNSQEIANKAAEKAIQSAQEQFDEAMWKALMNAGDVTYTEETQTVEGDNATINNNSGTWEQYNDNASKNGGGD